MHIIIIISIILLLTIIPYYIGKLIDTDGLIITSWMLGLAIELVIVLLIGLGIILYEFIINILQI